MNRLTHPIALTAAAAVIAGGCGGTHRVVTPSPKLPRALAQQLAVRSDDIAAKLDLGDDCGALAAARQLQQQTIAAINAQRVPAPFQEPLAAAANDLTLRIQCTPTATDDEHGKGKHKGHKKHGKDD